MLDNMIRGTVCIEDIEIGMTRHLKKIVTDSCTKDSQNRRMSMLRLLKFLSLKIVVTI